MTGPVERQAGPNGDSNWSSGEAEAEQLVKWRGRLSLMARQAEQTGQIERQMETATGPVEWQAESNGDSYSSNGEAG